MTEWMCVCVCVCVCEMEYYLVITKNGILPFVDNMDGPRG